MTHPSQNGPALRHEDKEMIPRYLVRGMFALALATLVLVTLAVVTGRDHIGQPEPAAIVRERSLVLLGGGAQAVTVTNPDGTVIADLDHGGFITVIQNGLQRARMKAGVDQTLPIRLVEYANGRLAVHDPATGWSAELSGFGGDNRAAFERMFDQ